MQKVLLLDTNVSSLPIYNFLVNKNYEVHVVGGNPNDFMARSVINYHNIDYSEIEKVLELIESLNIEFLIPGCNDLSYRICSLINSERNFFGIDSPEVTEIINNKEKFRNFAIKNKLPVPSLISKDELGNKWPVIVKPADAYSGRGVTVLKSSDDNTLEIAINRAIQFSRSKSYIIEKYIEGQLFSHSAFVSGGSIIIDFIVEEHGTANPFVVDTSRVIFDFQSDILEDIRRTINFMAERLNIEEGLIHTQFIKTKDSFQIIEITRRCPGDLYSKLIELSTGFKYAEAYAMPFLNQKIDVKFFNQRKSLVLRHTISQKSENIFASLRFNAEVHIENFFPLSLAGDMVSASPFGRIGLIFLSAKTDEELVNLFEKTLKRDLYELLDFKSI